MASKALRVSVKQKNVLFYGKCKIVVPINEGIVGFVAVMGSRNCVLIVHEVCSLFEVTA